MEYSISNVQVLAASLKVKGLRNKRQVVDSIVASPQVVGLGPTPRSWWGQDSGFIGWGEIWRAHNNLQEVSRWLSNFSRRQLVCCHWQGHWKHSKSVENIQKESNDMGSGFTWKISHYIKGKSSHRYQCLTTGDLSRTAPSEPITWARTLPCLEYWLHVHWGIFFNLLNWTLNISLAACSMFM